MAVVKDTILPGSARPRPPGSRLAQTFSADKAVIFTVFVRRVPGGPALPDLEHWQQTPANKRQFVSVEQYTKLFGASANDMQTTAAGLANFGMNILDQHLGARTLTVKASPSQISKAFGVTLNLYQSPTPAALLRRFKIPQLESTPETETHTGYDGQISIPNELAGIIVQVIGLDNRSTAVPGGGTGDPVNSFLQTVPGQAALYNFPNTGASNQTIGVFSAGGSYLSSDITTYFAGMPTGYTTPPTMVNVGLTVGSNSYSNNPSSVTSTTSIATANGNDLEVTQDILTSATIAQGCTTNVYFTDLTEQGWAVFLNRILFPQGEKQPNSVTISYIMFDETIYGTSLSTLFQQLAAVGINVFAAVGDWGADDNDIDGNEHVGYPGSDPWVTGVGGTVVGNVQSGPPVTFQEFVWSDEHSTTSNFSFTGGGTTGGGMSVQFPIPAYQTAAGITSFTDSNNVVKSGFRFVPDIAGMVGYTTFFCNGLGYNFIGTSCAAPLYAGLFAVLRSALGTSLGFLNPLLYQLGNTAYNDVTFGNNDSGDVPDSGFFSAAVGYDPASGWGSIDGIEMQAGLAKLLFPQELYITANKNTFGLAEVQGQATWTGTLLITLDGFAPNDLPSTGPTAITTLGSDATATVQKAVFQIPSEPGSVQRILFPVDITFGPKSAHPVNDPATPGIFPAAGSSVIEKALIADLTVGGQSFEAIISIELLAGADPFFSNLTDTENISNVGDSHAWYLSDDLRIFTVCPGVNSTPISSASVPGAPTLSTTQLTDFESNAGYSYITNLLTYFNNNFASATGADPFTLLPDQSNALTEDSLVAPTQIDPTNSSRKFANYAFAIARVRCNSSTGITPVKVFFRLFTSNNPQTWFLPATSYLSSPPAPAPPEAPLVASDMSSIPFFASGNLSSNSDYVSGGINNRTIPSSSPTYTYFGCFLNVYATDNTITFGGQTKPASAWLNGGHQCLVAQIAFDDAPIEEINGVLASPMNSDKLAQRNLQVTLSDNPGPPDTHLIPQAFDTAPTTPPDPDNDAQFSDRPDELMIDWGNAPVGSSCEIYWPQVQAADVVALANQLYPTHQLSVSSGDANTITTSVIEGFTLVPIPFGSGPNFAGLVTLQLPPGIAQGQTFVLTVRRIATRTVINVRPPSIARARKLATPVQQRDQQQLGTRPTEALNWRYAAGNFAIKIPVTIGAQMLPIDRDNQAITAWRLNQMRTSDRWYPVIQRYLSYLARRIDGLGAGNLPVVPSPVGAGPIPGGPKGGGGECCARHDCGCERCARCGHCHLCCKVREWVKDHEHDHGKCHHCE